MDRIVTVKMAVYFFCIVSSALSCAMELEVRKSKDYSWMQNTLFVDQKMKRQYGIPHDVAGVIVQKSCALRMDTIYKKFDPFFHFNVPNYQECFAIYPQGLKGLKINLEISLAAQKYEAQEYCDKTCRKFDAVAPKHLFFFTENQDEILCSLISRPGCFIHHKDRYCIELKNEEPYKYFMLPAEFRDVLSKYPWSYVDKK